METSVENFIGQPVSAARTRALRALWHAAHNDWRAAHEEAQEGSDADSAWVHALLHREEGDATNAVYWYRRAGKPVYRGTIEQERTDIITALLRSQV